MGRRQSYQSAIDILFKKNPSYVFLPSSNMFLLAEFAASFLPLSMIPVGAGFGTSNLAFGGDSHFFNYGLPSSSPNFGS